MRNWKEKKAASISATGKTFVFKICQTDFLLKKSYPEMKPGACTETEQAFSGEGDTCKNTYGVPNYNFLYLI